MTVAVLDQRPSPRDKKGDKKGKKRGGGFAALALILSAVLVIPIIAVIVLAFAPEENVWPHLLDTVLPGYVWTTALLMLGVGFGTFVVGVGTAWLVAMCDFPGRKIFDWALLLPMAMPAYVVAYAFVDLFDYSGLVQATLRDLIGATSPRDYWFFEIRSLGGAIAVMTLVLYPYIYMTARTAFLSQSVCLLEVGRTLGRSAWGTFFSIGLPLARPAIAVGVALAAMECLNDFGTVDYFAVQTLGAGLYDVWFSMNNVGGAAQIACVMLTVVVLLVAMERAGRQRQKFHNMTGRYRKPARVRLSVGHAIASIVVCALPILIGLVLPVVILATRALEGTTDLTAEQFVGAAGSSFLLAGIAGAITVGIALFLVYAARLSGNDRGAKSARVVSAASWVTSFGYALPGVVLAVGILIPFGALDNFVDGRMRDWFGISTGLILSGTVAALTFAYVVRFLTLAQGTVDSGLARVTPHIDMAARTLGAGPGTVLTRVHLPMIRGSLVTALILVFVDCMKELPATLLLRPFNFETLATLTYNYASLEQIEDAAMPALSIALLGLIPVILLSRAISSGQPDPSPYVDKR